MNCFASLILVLAVAGSAHAQAPDTIEQAIAQVKRITDPDPAAQDRKRAEEAMRIVQNRMKVINDVSGTFLQTIPIDVWNQVCGDGTIRDRARVLDVARAKGWPLSKVAWFVKAGACDEHASVMQEILQGAGVRNVRIFRSNSPFFFQAEDGIRDLTVTGVQTCALPI